MQSCLDIEFVDHRDHYSKIDHRILQKKNKTIKTMNHLSIKIPSCLTGWFQGKTVTFAPSWHKIRNWLFLRPQSIQAIDILPVGLKTCGFYEVNKKKQWKRYKILFTGIETCVIRFDLFWSWNEIDFGSVPSIIIYL